MALDPVSEWKQKLLSMKPASLEALGVDNLANFIGEMTDKLQLEGGTPGVFKFNKAAFTAALLGSGFAPNAGNGWAAKLADAWAAGCLAAVITPGTVSDPLWTASSRDVLTLPVGLATIVTVPAARVLLEAKLLAASQGFQSMGGAKETGASQEKMASAFREAALELKFNCIGLMAAGAAPVPMPKVFSVK